MAYKERLQNNNDELKDIIAIAESLPEAEFVPSGTLDITVNGEYDVAEYEKASVNVPIPEGYIKPTGSINITENGVYDVTEYEEVEVEVAGGGDDTVKSLVEGTPTDINNSDATLVGQYAFYHNRTLVNVNLPNVTKIDQYAFQGCAIKSISAPKVTTIGEYAFQSCSALDTVNFPEASGEISSNSFGNCTSLKNAYLPNITALGPSAFNGCTSLTSISLPKVTNPGSSAFSGCQSLESADLPALTFLYNQMFANCKALKTVNIPLATSLANRTFQYCYELERFDAPVATSAGTYLFQDCYSLKTVILRRDIICSLNNVNAFANCYHFHGTVNETYNPNGDKDGYIYVPSKWIEGYKGATNWSTFADRFRAIEDYPEICGEV